MVPELAFALPPCPRWRKTDTVEAAARVGSLYVQPEPGDARAPRVQGVHPPAILEEDLDTLLSTGRSKSHFRSRKTAEAVPRVRDDWSPASRGLEQANARRIPCPNHLSSGDVQRESLSVIEPAMPRWRQVINPHYVFGPRDFRRIERTSNSEAPVRPLLGGPYQKRLEGWLAVLAVGAEISQVPLLGNRSLFIVNFGIHGTIECPRASRPEHARYASMLSRP